ncbi:MAG: hypothetical protein JF609_04510 [Verrucomicrobia bacterium]|nr:hypothetical protein [Verrucomicrobiota bacterium]
MVQNIASILERELSSGEKLLWSGRPLGGIRLRKQDAFMVPFSLMWGGFAIFWEAGVIYSNAPFFFRLWGIPFVLVGLYLILGRFFVDAKLREKTFYGISDERVLIISGFFSRNLRSLNLKTLSEINLSEKEDGTGTIAFGPAYPMTQFPGGGWPSRRGYTPPSFEMIERVRDVYDIIRRAQSDSVK